MSYQKKAEELAEKLNPYEFHNTIKSRSRTIALLKAALRDIAREERRKALKEVIQIVTNIGRGAIYIEAITRLLGEGEKE